MVIVQKYWTVLEEVDKTLLRKEVQEFCGHFPVIRLQEVDLSSAAVGIGKEKTFARSRLGKYQTLKIRSTQVNFVCRL